MRNTFTIFLLLICIGCFEPKDLSKTGFTDKSKAKNKVKHGRLEGKWVNYQDADFNLTTDVANAAYYRLAVFKHDLAEGMVRVYFINGKIEREAPFVHGLEN